MEKKKYYVGDKKRGEEIIETLKNQGGKNYYSLIGESINSIYFLGYNGDIECKSIGYINDHFLQYYEKAELPCKFKDGDIIFSENYSSSWVFILKGNFNEDYYSYYASCMIKSNYGNEGRLSYDYYASAQTKSRLATESEKKLFINALKKGSDPRNKEILSKYFNIREKWMPKAQEWVLVRDTKEEKWQLSQFAYYDSKATYPYTICGGNVFYFCIPYNDVTKHLLGTTEDYKID